MSFYCNGYATLITDLCGENQNMKLLFMTHKFLSLVATLLLVLFSRPIMAQNGTIKGSIIDEITKEPLIGAAVLIEGTTKGASTDLDGNYEIQNVDAGTYTLRASYVSYETVIKKVFQL